MQIIVGPTLQLQMFVSMTSVSYKRTQILKYLRILTCRCKNGGMVKARLKVDCTWGPFEIRVVHYTAVVHSHAGLLRKVGFVNVTDHNSRSKQGQSSRDTRGPAVGDR